MVIQKAAEVWENFLMEESFSVRGDENTVKVTSNEGGGVGSGDEWLENGLGQATAMNVVVV